MHTLLHESQSLIYLCILEQNLKSNESNIFKLRKRKSPNSGTSIVCTC